MDSLIDEKMNEEIDLSIDDWTIKDWMKIQDSRFKIYFLLS